MDPKAAMTQTGGMDLTVWGIMFGVLIVIALVLAYMSKDMER
nr:hypothetical protein [Sulfurimonas sp. MAG313]